MLKKIDHAVEDSTMMWFKTFHSRKKYRENVRSITKNLEKILWYSQEDNSVTLIKINHE